GLAGRPNAITLTGAGFKDGEEALVSPSPQDLFDLQYAQVDSSGNWTFDIATDSAAPAGTYTITAAGIGGLSATAAYSINSGTAAPFLGGSPSALTAETTNKAGSFTRRLTLVNNGST